MFPWSPEFVWDAGHVAFFGGLYGVLAAIAAGLCVAAWRTLRHHRAGRVHAVAWNAEFEHLPGAARPCRHQLTGEAPGRTCGNGFDCRRCPDHEALEDLRARVPRPVVSESGWLGVDLPQDRLYHRGHTWVRPEADGTVSVGLDEIARRLVGTPEVVDLPAVGERLREHAALVFLRSRGSDVRLLSPVDGTVTAVLGTGTGFVLRLAPAAPVDTRHLLSGGEARVWAVREIERLQRALAPEGSIPALADGGELVADVGAAVPRERYDALLGEMLLEP